MADTAFILLTLAFFAALAAAARFADTAPSQSSGPATGPATGPTTGPTSTSTETHS